MNDDTSIKNLITSRLQLVPLTMHDLALFHATNTDPFVREFLWDDEMISKETSQAVLEEVEKRFAQDHWGLWKILTRANQQYIGYTGLWTFFGEDQPQLLYVLLPAHTGQGYATEAALRIIRYAFEALHFTYLTASLDKPNTKSVEVCKRLHMESIAERTINGKPTIFYKLTNSKI